MISFKYIPIVLSLILASAFVKAEYLRNEDLKSLVVSCYLENEIPVFCSKKIDDPHIKLYLPLFKSVIIDDKIHAFRIMATIENLSKKNSLEQRLNLSLKI